VRRPVALAIGLLAASAGQSFTASFHAVSLSLGGQADPARRIAISLPTGTKLGDGGRIGSGSATLGTGFAPPFTQIPASVTLAKRKRQLILSVAPHGGDLPPFTLTGAAGRSKLAIAVPPMCVPGYVPCHEIALDRLGMSMRKLTRPRCPRSRRFIFTATVTYRDGPAKTTRTAASCRRARRA
jgi:hypothetical protein